MLTWFWIFVSNDSLWRYFRHLKLRVSTCRFGLGLCPTRNWPDDIGFLARKPAADCKNQRVRSDRICLIGSQIGRSQRRCYRRFHLAVICIFRLIFAGSEKKTPNRSRIYAKLTRSKQKKNQIVVGFVQNSRDLSKKTPNHRRICPKFTRSEQKNTKSSPDLCKTR